MKNLFNKIGYTRKIQIFGYACIAPAFLILLVFFVYPFIQAIITSTHTGLGLQQRFVGLQNYKDIFSGWRFWNSLKVTSIFTLIYGTVSITLAIILASIIQQKIHFKVFFTTAIFMPYIITRVIAGLVWQYMFNHNFGLINYFLGMLGIEAIPWLKNGIFALLALSLIQIWLTVGYNTILFSSGMQAIPQSYYEASRIDGANSIQRLIYITVPLILPTLFFVILITILQGFIHSFVLAQIVTGGGPFNATSVVMHYIYQLGLEQFDLPMANAVTLITFSILFVISTIQHRIQEKTFKGLH